MTKDSVTSPSIPLGANATICTRSWCFREEPDGADEYLPRNYPARLALPSRERGRTVCGAGIMMEGGTG